MFITNLSVVTYFEPYIDSAFIFSQLPFHFGLAIKTKRHSLKMDVKMTCLVNLIRLV